MHRPNKAKCEKVPGPKTEMLKGQACCLDILPTNFFKSCFYLLAADVLKIVNVSLLAHISVSVSENSCYKTPSGIE